MAADFADAAPEALAGAFSQLLETVNNVTNRPRVFNHHLTRLQSTLASLSPSVEQIRQLNGEVGHPEEETKRLIEQMTKGNKLVLKCSKIPWWIPSCAVSSCTSKLSELEEDIRSFFQVDFHRFNARNGSEALAVVEDVHSTQSMN